MKKNILLFTLVIMSGAVQSQDAAKMIKNIHTASGEISTLQELLQSDDKTLRTAALSEMLQSKATAMRELAYQNVFNGTDTDLQQIALSFRMQSLDRIALQFSGKSPLLDSIPSPMVISVKARSTFDGSYTLNAKNIHANASLSGGVLSAKMPLLIGEKEMVCDLLLTHQKSAVMQGTLECEKQILTTTVRFY